MTGQEIECAMTRFGIVQPDRGCTKRWTRPLVGGSSWSVEIHATWRQRDARPQYAVALVDDAGTVRPILHTDVVEEAARLFCMLAVPA